MIESLKFVQGAVAKKDFAAELTHFSIKDGIILGYNGNLSLSSPIDLDWDIYPKAIPFVKAIEACKERVVLSKTKNGRLSVKSGSFQAFVECLEEDIFPHQQPEGEYVPLQGDFIPAIKNIVDFIGVDASRPWATGILFDGDKAYATNNIIIAEQQLPDTFPVRINVPSYAIKELLRVKLIPIAVQSTDSSVTFHFEGGRWMRSQLYSNSWPEAMYRILGAPSNQVKVPEGFFEALETIQPFLEKNNSVYFEKDALSTSQDKGDGATVEVPGLLAGASFQFKPLYSLMGKIDTIDFTQYPKPCIFKGDGLTGAIVGMVRG